MIVNGLKLPEDFVSMLEAGHLGRVVGGGELKEDVDAYGNHLETELSEVYTSADKIERETSKLPEDFRPDGYYGEDYEEGEPGFIPDITDFTKVVCFAASGDGAPFCFDFRDDPSEPSVIWWDDAYWRRVAPDFTSFISLFHLDPHAGREQR